jgi:hypothetical protein
LHGSVNLPAGFGGQQGYPMKNRYTVASIARFRAPAAEQRRRGLKVGGTATEFQIIDNETGDKARIVAYGPTPGDRKTAALEQFRQMQADGDSRIIAFADQQARSAPRWMAESTRIERPWESKSPATLDDGIDAVEDRAHARAMREIGPGNCSGCGYPHGGPDCAVF